MLPSTQDGGSAWVLAGTVWPHEPRTESCNRAESEYDGEEDVAPCFMPLGCLGKREARCPPMKGGWDAKPGSACEECDRPHPSNYRAPESTGKLA